MPLINSETNIIQNWTANCVICEVDTATTFAINDTKLFVPAATVSYQDNTKATAIEIRIQTHN